MFVRRNIDWMHNSFNHPPQKNDPAHHRCPRRGQQYRPWMKKDGYSEANKMYVIHQEAQFHVQDVVLEVGEVYCHPVFWPSTETTNLVNRFKDIASDMDTAIQGLDGRERMQYIHGQVMSHPMKTYMQTCPVSAEAIGSLDNLRKDPLRPRRYEHLVQQGGVQGWHALNCAEAEVFKLDDVARCWGFAQFLILPADLAM